MRLLGTVVPVHETVRLLGEASEVAMPEVDDAQLTLGIDRIGHTAMLPSQMERPVSGLQLIPGWTVPAAPAKA